MKKLKSFTVVSALLLVLNGSVCLVGRWRLLIGDPFLHGADAYYYALQVRSLVETGALRMADAAPLLPLMAWTARLGAGYEGAVALWAVLAQACCAGSLLAAALILRGRRGLGLGAVLFAWAVLSPVLTFTAIEFPKYALAMAFLPLWPVGLHKPRYLPLSLGVILFSCANHRALVGVAGLAAIGLGLTAVIMLKPKRVHVLLGAAGLAAAVAAALFLGRDYFSPADLARIDFRGLRPGLWTFLSREAIPAPLKLEAAAACAGSLFLLFTGKGRSWSAAAGRAWGSLVMLALVPLGSVEVMGLAERLVLLLPVLALSSIAFTKRSQADEKARAPRFRWIAPPLLTSVLVLSALHPAWHLNLAHPVRLDPDYALYDRVTSELMQRDIPMLIAHRSLNFYYKYKTLRDSFLYEPEPHWPSERIWRAARGIEPAEWAHYLPDDCLWGSGKLFALPGPYDLVREDAWRVFRAGVAGSGDEELIDRVWNSWLNPSQPRPGFLRKPDDEGEFSAHPPVGLK